MTERRSARRYDLSLPVSIRLPIQNEAVSGNGKTGNISTRGVYFTTGNRLSAGTQLDLTMTLSAKVTGGSQVFIRAVGQVVRVDQRFDNGGRLVGVAAVIEQHEIIRSEAPIA
jgi:PilZ domain